ncbi:hypothetical protein EVAR_101271_1 [Eumeta japonica]|uniref:Uncharacterized protein n=1 Tax=Eumeta variegata TaxID=151549 RepID=A0A4C1T609_EUMVA|nr:hypothetical protein EVAR_101271_1 [Eumeta japonica]
MIRTTRVQSFKTMLFTVTSLPIEGNAHRLLAIEYTIHDQDYSRAKFQDYAIHCYKFTYRETITAASSSNNWSTRSMIRTTRVQSFKTMLFTVTSLPIEGNHHRCIVF